MVKRDWLLLVLRVLAGLLLVPATCLLLLAVVTWLSGDGIADAAPWWVFFAFLAAGMGFPGLLILLLARWRAMRGSEKYYGVNLRLDPLTSLDCRWFHQGTASRMCHWRSELVSCDRDNSST